MAELIIDISLALGPRTLRASVRSESGAMALVGPSGAGKSTILRVVAGVEHRASGFVGFDGAIWQDNRTFIPAWLRHVGWVPQDGVLFPHLSVRENLAYAARLDVQPIAELLGVQALLERKPRHLSGGERQRVALGRAMASSPQLLLLDEPFSALDRPLRAELGAAVAEWTASRGIAVMVVTHDSSDVAALAKEVWEIQGNQVVRAG